MNEVTQKNRIIQTEKRSGDYQRQMSSLLEEAGEELSIEELKILSDFFDQRVKQLINQKKAELTGEDDKRVIEQEVDYQWVSTMIINMVKNKKDFLNIYMSNEKVLEKLGFLISCFANSSLDQAPQYYKYQPLDIESAKKICIEMIKALEKILTNYSIKRISLSSSPIFGQQEKKSIDSWGDQPGFVIIGYPKEVGIDNKDGIFAVCLGMNENKIFVKYGNFI